VFFQLQLAGCIGSEFLKIVLEVKLILKSFFQTLEALERIAEDQPVSKRRH
jgi:hypothetical protein